MVPVELRQWALRHHVSLEALAELGALLGADPSAPPPGSIASETNVQARVRLAAPALGMRLHRNNVGCLRDERGVPIRYGLANDTAALNARLKSSDLIGWRRMVVTSAMVGQTIAQFTSIEVKSANWAYRGDAHEQAQLRWLSLVVADGGYAKFVTSPEQI